MKCEHEMNEAFGSSFGRTIYWCPMCGSLGIENPYKKVHWASPANQSGICPCGGYQVRAYDAALDSYRLVCEECGR